LLTLDIVEAASFELACMTESGHANPKTSYITDVLEKLIFSAAVCYD
jgi:hypothetical protein